MPWKAPAIAAAGTVASTAIGARRSRIEARKAREYDRRMWHEQMEYNHPAQQRKRMIEAGLNPALMYTQGDTGTVASHPTGEFSAAPYIDPTSTMMDYFNIQQKSQHIKYEKQKTELTRFQTWTEQAKHRNLVMDEELKTVEWYFKWGTLEERQEQEKLKVIYQTAKNVVERKRAEWASKGMNPNDATWLRFTIEWLEDLGIAPGQLNPIREAIERYKKITKPRR